jgi:hypothetical protein
MTGGAGMSSGSSISAALPFGLSRQVRVLSSEFTDSLSNLSLLNSTIAQSLLLLITGSPDNFRASLFRNSKSSLLAAI